MDEARPNHFQRFGLEPSVDISASDLEQRYLALCRQHHPDHAGGDLAAQAAAEEATSEINEAYRVLSDPGRRADYLLMLRGGLPAEQDHTLPEGFLQLILELREEMEAAQEKADHERGESLMRQVEEQREEFLRLVHQGFARPLDAHGLRDLRRDLNALRYLERILSSR